MARSGGQVCARDRSPRVTVGARAGFGGRSFRNTSSPITTSGCTTTTALFGNDLASLTRETAAVRSLVAGLVLDVTSRYGPASSDARMTVRFVVITHRAECPRSHRYPGCVRR